MHTAWRDMLGSTMAKHRFLLLVPDTTAEVTILGMFIGMHPVLYQDGYLTSILGPATCGMSACLMLQGSVYTLCSTQIRVQMSSNSLDVGINCSDSSLQFSIHAGWSGWHFAPTLDWCQEPRINRQQRIWPTESSACRITVPWGSWSWADISCLRYPWH